ncbi:hypothetical protein [Parenemella sanctibonifatiensis]|nr:hypothetical protein [Parenemella sanctibonifatiensis]
MKTNEYGHSPSWSRTGSPKLTSTISVSSAIAAARSGTAKHT